MALEDQIPFHRDKTNTFTIFYDVSKGEFYRKYTKINQSSGYPFSAIMATLTYPIVSGLTFSFIAKYPIIGLVSSFILVVLFYMITISILKRKWTEENIDYFPITSRDRMYRMIEEGKEDLQKLTWIISIHFLLNIILVFALIATPGSVLLYVVHTFFWWTFLILIFATKYFKRRKLYMQLEEKLPHMPI